MDKKIPRSLFVLSWIEIILGFIFLGMGIFWFFYLWSYMSSARGSISINSLINLFLYSIVIFLPLCILTQSIGFLRRKRWAWTVHVYIFPIINYLFIYMFWKWDSRWFYSLLPFFICLSLIPILSIIYLLKPSIKSYIMKY